MMIKRTPRTTTGLLAAASAAVAVLAASRAAWATSSAELYTPTAYGYGRFEARVLFPSPDGVVGSFFLWKDGSEATGAYWNELDFEKVGGDCALQVNSIYGAPMAGHPTLVNGVSGLCAGYHTYTFEWTPDHVVWLVDGVEGRRDVGAGAQAYAQNATAGLQLRFNIWPGTPTFGGTFSASSLPVQEFISWVAYARYTPGAGDGGGDFTLAWRESFEDGIPPAWGMGNWPSPLQQSIHSPLNVTASAGVAAISLTADDALGFTATPPVDPGDLPSASSGSVVDGGAADAGDTADASDAVHPEASGGGCGCHTSGGFGSQGGVPLAMALLALLARGRRSPTPTRFDP